MITDCDFDQIFNKPVLGAIIGETGSGKTTLCYDILKKQSHRYEYIYLFSTNHRAKEMYKKYIYVNHIKIVQEGELNIHIKNIIEFNESFNDIDDLKTVDTVESKSPNTLLIFDDMGDFQKDKEVFGSIIKTRHSNISCLFLVHRWKSVLSTNIRSQLQFVITCGLILSPEEIKEICSNYKGELKVVGYKEKMYYVFVNHQSKYLFKYFIDLESKDSEKKNCYIHPNNKSEMKEIMKYFIQKQKIQLLS